MEQSSGHLHPAGPPLIPSLKIDQKFGTKSWGILHRENVFHGSNDASLFSSSLPVLPHEKLKFYREPKIQFVDDASSKLKNSSIGMDGKDSLDDVDLQAIRLSLPGDEDELLAGIMDDFDLSELPSQVEDLEEYDIFGSGGGIELDLDPTESLNDTMPRASIGDGYAGNGFAHYGPSNGVGSVVGEHPYGEHPSRTLFVRNINSNIEDSELQALFEQYGDIRTLYTACKHRGFVMISYYDIRDARTAMHALQNKPLRRRKLDIHFSIPKDNQSDKDMNQGTLVVFNLDPLVSNDELLQIFGAYGEVKEIRETPHRKNHRFIEFYDVRAAEAALRSLNRIDIAGKRIKLEPSRPFGARRNLMHQLNQELDDETKFYRQHMGSPITNSPPGNWAEFLRPVENGLQQPLTNSSTMGAMNHMGNNHLQGLASVLSPLRSNTVKIAPIGKHQSRIVHADHVFANDSSSPGLSFQYSRSFPPFPDHSRGMMMNMSSNPGELSSFCPLTSNASGVGMLSGPQFLWGSPTPYSESSQSSAWQTPPTGHSFSSNGPSYHGSLLASSRQHHHHVGSAPSGIPFDRYFDYVPESPDTSFMISEAFGLQNRPMTNSVARTPMNPGVPLSGFMSENGLPNFGMMPSHRFEPAFYRNAPYPVLGSVGIESQLERRHTQRIDSRSQLDSKHLYQLDLEKVVSEEDTRTTLMIKNIPNKYTSKMLIATIDKNHKCTYDFLYLPIDFKNKCNVGYAFINMVSPSHIMSFHQAFDGKKWEKFNSEKVASLAYARIQGKAALIAHFKNSSLMNEDKQHRPIVFNSEGPESNQEVLPLNGMTVCVWKQDGTLSDWESQEKGKPLAA